MNETKEVTRVIKRCVCGGENGHVCTLSHRERVLKYANYCVENKLYINICTGLKITPFTHVFRGCLHCGIELKYGCFHNIFSNSKKYYGYHANACDNCSKTYLNNNKYCFVNMEIPSVCHATKPLRQLLIRELYNQHKVPRDIRNLINSLLSCGC